MRSHMSPNVLASGPGLLRDDNGDGQYSIEESAGYQDDSGPQETPNFSVIFNLVGLHAPSVSAAAATTGTTPTASAATVYAIHTAGPPTTAFRATQRR